MSNLPYSKDNPKSFPDSQNYIKPPFTPSKEYLKEQQIIARGSIMVLQSLLRDGKILYRNKKTPKDPWVVSYNARINTVSFDYKPYDY